MEIEGNQQNFIALITDSIGMRVLCKLNGCIWMQIDTRLESRSSSGSCADIYLPPVWSHTQQTSGVRSAAIGKMTSDTTEPVSVTCGGILQQN